MSERYTHTHAHAHTRAHTRAHTHNHNMYSSKMHNTNGEGVTGRVQIKGRRVRIIEMRNIINKNEL